MEATKKRRISSGRLVCTVLLARFLLLFCTQLFLVVFAWGNSLLAYIGRFRVSMALALKNSLFLMLANAARFLLLAVLFLLHIILAVFFPWAVLVLPASYALCVNRLLDKIFQGHITTDCGGRNTRPPFGILISAAALRLVGP